jgi:ankyrin repeat protein
MRAIVLLFTLFAAAQPFHAAAQESRSPTSPAEPPLAEAIRLGDAAALQRLLEAGADPNTMIPTGEDGWTATTPLGLALFAATGTPIPGEDERDDATSLGTSFIPAPERHTDVVRLLLQAGADPNRVVGADDQTTPLEAAVFTSPDVVRLLLDAGADPDVASCRSGGEVSTPLWIAEFAGQSDIAEVLRQAGAEDPFRSGAELAVERNAAATPLHAAVWNGDHARVQRLLAAGADPNAVITGRRLPTGEVERFTPLSLVLPFAARESRENEPVSVDGEMIRLLLGGGADPDAPFDLVCTADRPTPLLMAAINMEVDLLQLLLEAGADPNARVELGGAESSLLILAAQMGVPQLVRVLLEAGADPNMAVVESGDPYATTPLPAAIGSGSAGVVQLLLEAGADPHQGIQVGEEYSSLLVIAAGVGSSDMVRLLLEAGADPNREARFRGKSLTPLAVALQGEHIEMAALLRAAGAKESPGVEQDRDEAAGSWLPEVFEVAFVSCTAGQTMSASMAPLDVRVRYDILGSEGSGCRISLTFESNPNPEWVEKPLLLTLDPQQPFLVQLEEGMRSCMSGRGDRRFGCAGPLLEVLRPDIVTHGEAGGATEAYLLREELLRVIGRLPGRPALASEVRGACFQPNFRKKPANWPIGCANFL